MKFVGVLLWIAMFAVLVPVHGQQPSNTSLLFQRIEIPANEFNRLLEDSVVVPFEQTHAVSWQVTIKNNLLYANPNGNAVVRLYDANVDNKFVEIGMGSPPDKKFWVALNFPEKGYLPATRIDKNGWMEGTDIIAGYNDAQGITISNGQRIVVSGIDLDNFVVGSYSVYGIMDPADPPAMNSGTLSMEILSGDASQNPIHYFPYIVTGVVGGIIGVLLVLKKRST